MRETNNGYWICADTQNYLPIASTVQYDCDSRPIRFLNGAWTVGTCCDESCSVEAGCDVEWTKWDGCDVGKAVGACCDISWSIVAECDAEWTDWDDCDTSWNIGGAFNVGWNSGTECVVARNDVVWCGGRHDVDWRNECVDSAPWESDTNWFEFYFFCKRLNFGMLAIQYFKSCSMNQLIS